MKSIWKYLLGIAVVLLFVGYAIFSRQSAEMASPNITSTSTDMDTGAGTPGGVSTTTNTSTQGTIPTSTGTTTGPTGLYKDGTYTGTAADAFYGTIQVQATVSGGAITDVTFLQYPDAPGHTTDVSNMALPALKQEALAAQSAKVNVVSGATQDSQAFQQSLASALAQAKS